MSLKNRDIKIDALRGFAIILVVVGHIIQTSFLDYDENHFFRIIYSFHMPLFMFISGYVAYLSVNFSAPITNIFKKFIQLGIPFLSWYFIFDVLFRRAYGNISIIDSAKQLILNIDMGFWFLWALFLCFVVLNLSSYLFRIMLFTRKYIDIVYYTFLVLVLFNINVQIFGVPFLKNYFIYFIIGYLLKKYLPELSRLKEYSKEIALTIFIVLLVGWFRGQIPLPISLLDINIISQESQTLVYNLIIAFSGILVTYFMIEKAIENILAQKILTYIGKYTLEIYIMHLYAISFLSVYIVGIGNNILSITIKLIIGLFVPIFFSKYFLGQSKIMKLLFLGKYK